MFISLKRSREVLSLKENIETCFHIHLQYSHSRELQYVLIQTDYIIASSCVYAPNLLFKMNIQKTTVIIFHFK